MKNLPCISHYEKDERYSLIHGMENVILVKYPKA